MVQPYQEAVNTEGEVGLIFLGGAFSHAIHKGPMTHRGAGTLDSLIDNQVVTPVSPSAAQLELGRVALGAAEALFGPTTYARVDTVTGAGGAPALLELELLDPMLFFVTDPAPGGALHGGHRGTTGLTVSGRAGGLNRPLVRATAASGSRTRKLMLSSMYNRTTSASWSR